MGYFDNCNKYLSVFLLWVVVGFFQVIYVSEWSSCGVINNDLIHPSPRVLGPVGGKQGGLT